MPDPQDPARPREGGELVLPPLELPGAARAPDGRELGLRAAAPVPQRGAGVRRPGTQRRLAHARPPEVGHRSAVGSRPGLLRLVRRAAQLRHGARLRTRRAGPDRRVLARDVPPRRQGHPQVPHDLLARAAARGRSAGARARLRPRLPADARRLGLGAQDVQVARERARSVRGDGHVRDRRAALLPVPRGLVRAGRQRLHDHVRRALRGRAGERARQPREPHAVDDRPLPRRDGARGRSRPGAGRRLRRACATR